MRGETGRPSTDSPGQGRVGPAWDLEHSQGASDGVGPKQDWGLSHEGNGSVFPAHETSTEKSVGGTAPKWGKGCVRAS